MASQLMCHSSFLHRSPDDALLVDAIAVVFVGHNFAVYGIAVPTPEGEAWKCAAMAENSGQVSRREGRDLITFSATNPHEHAVAGRLP